MRDASDRCCLRWVSTWTKVLVLLLSSLQSWLLSFSCGFWISKWGGDGFSKPSHSFLLCQWEEGMNCKYRPTGTYSVFELLLTLLPSHIPYPKISVDGFPVGETCLVSRVPMGPSETVLFFLFAENVFNLAGVRSLKILIWRDTGQAFFV